MINITASPREPWDSNRLRMAEELWAAKLPGVLDSYRPPSQFFLFMGMSIVREKIAIFKMHLCIFA